MKTMNFKRSLWLTAILLSSVYAGAQTKNNFYHITEKEGKRTESVQADYEGKSYLIEWANEKMSSLSVDGTAVPQVDWPKYSVPIQHVRQELKEQAKRNAEQASRNQEQAGRNKIQARLNAAQQERNAKQATRNEAQALLNQEQAEKNDAQAKAMEELMDAITIDLVNDHIIKDKSDLRQLSFSGRALSVNDIKQPEVVTKKYYTKYSKEKYRVLYNHFNYDRDGIVKENQ